MNTQDPVVPEELRLGELIRGLKVSHAWAVVALAAGLLAGAFSVGYKASSWAGAVGAQRVAISVAKHEFFTRYNRYITNRDSLQAHFSLEAETEFEQAEKLLFELIHGWWTSQSTFSGDMNFQPEVIRKGFDPRKSLVIFADGAEFVIPPEIKQKVLEASGEN